MKEGLNENRTTTKLWKKIICVILSLIMALGTFVTMTFGNILLSDKIDIQNAFAATISPVPLFYRYGELVGLYRVNYTDKTTLQYKIGENGEWTDYFVPFAVPAHQTTKVYARIGTTGKATYMNFSTTNEALGVYTESNTDFEFSYNNINFGYTRIYNSAEKNWFESIHSKVLATNSRLEVTLPDNTKYPMIRKTASTYVDELTGKTLTKTSSNYIFDDGDYKYYFAIKGLNSIAYLSAIEDNNGNRLNLNRTTNSEEISISDGTGRSFYISDYYGIEAPDDSDANYYSVKEITDPNNNKIKYTTKLGRYISVVDQAGVTLGDYDYVSDTTDYTLIKSNGNTIEYYDNGRLKKITYQNGSWIQYTYNDDSMNYTTLTSSGETTKTVYNDAFYPVEYTDESGETTTYTYDDHYRVLTETCGTNTTTYSYDTNGNLVSYTTGDSESNTYYTYDTNKRVIREQIGNDYTYYTYDDKENNLVYATLKKDYTGEAPSEYDSSLTCFDTICYTYDDNGRVIKEENSNGTSTAYEYDNRGNITKETYTVTEDGETKTTVKTYTYDAFGNVLTTGCENDTSSYIYDAAGRTLLANENGEYTRTLYDDQGRVIQEIGPEDYDSTKDGLPSANTYSDSTAGHTYVYDSTTGNLTSETNRLGVTSAYTYYSTGEKKTESFDIYKYEYNIKGNITKVYVDGVNTLTYNYDENYNLISEIYANGQSIRYEYDDNSNLIKQYHNNDTSPYVTYSYNTNNELTQKINTDTGLKYVYGENNSVSVYKTSDNTLVQSYTETATEADEDNDIEAKTDVTETHFGNAYSYIYKDKSIEYTAGTNKASYSYETDSEDKTTSDSVKYKNNSIVSSEYTYDDNGNITKKSINYNNAGNSKYYKFAASYDDKNRITAYGYTRPLDVYVTYDEHGQIARVNNRVVAENKYTATYTYDSRGNITEKNIYGYTRAENITQTPTETTTFTYSNSGWKDQLITVNGVELTYDANGNVLTYGDREYSWTNGRSLAQITDGENTYSYTYDENGIRTSKTVNGKTTRYNTLGGVILSQTDGTDTWYFQYDTSGMPLGFIYNGTQYFYLINQMGDVISIVDTNGVEIAGYEYDEWGKPILAYAGDESDATQVKIANANPILYRGYYYDYETGYYYLQSRYYDPSICRFINADDYTYSDANTYVGCNIYSYCNNDPENCSDESGTSSKLKPIDLLKRFLTKYLLKGKTISKYSKFTQDKYSLYSANVYYKKSKKNTNKVTVTFGYQSAWKKNTTWSNQISKKSKLISNYFSSINKIMTSSPPQTESQAANNKAIIISSNMAMAAVILGSGISAATIASKYNKVWGQKGVDPKNKQGYLLFKVSNERTLNGWYVYNYSKSKLVKKL